MTAAKRDWRFCITLFGLAWLVSMSPDVAALFGSDGFSESGPMRIVDKVVYHAFTATMLAFSALVLGSIGAQIAGWAFRIETEHDSFYFAIVVIFALSVWTVLIPGFSSY